MQWHWHRVRPGLYELYDADGIRRGIVERGGETCRWWWQAMPLGSEEMPAGRAFSMRAARFSVEKWARP